MAGVLGASSPVGPLVERPTGPPRAAGGTRNAQPGDRRGIPGRRTPRTGFERLLRRNELVAGPADRHDPLRLRRVALELAPQVRRVDVAGVLVADVRALPQVLHDLA